MNFKGKMEAIPNIINLVPGTLRYTGDKKSDILIDVYLYNELGYKHETFKNVDKFLKSSIHADLSGYEVGWFNITGISNVSSIDLITKHFNMSLLQTEQVLNISNHNDFKMEPSFIFSNLQMMYYESTQVKREKMSIYKKGKVLLTFQEEPGDVFDSIRDRIKEGIGQIRQESSHYLYYTMLDAIVDHYLVIAKESKARLKHLESDIYRYNKTEINDIFKLKKILSRLELVSEPLKVHLEALIQDQQYEFKDKSYYLNQLMSHMEELTYEIQASLNIAEYTTDLFLNINSYKMNKTMTVLTIFSAIFIPLSFLAGIFGMNFTYLPLINNPNGFFIFTILSVLSIIIVLWIVRNINVQK